MGVSRIMAHKWVSRWRAEGEAGLRDRSSRPHTTPHRTPAPHRVAGVPPEAGPQAGPGTYRADPGPAHLIASHSLTERGGVVSAGAQGGFRPGARAVVGPCQGHRTSAAYRVSGVWFSICNWNEATDALNSCARLTKGG